MFYRSLRLGLAITSFVIGSTAFPARADSPPGRPAAEALSIAGSELMALGRYDEACARYEESHVLDPATRRQLVLAECNERRGKTATAWVWFLEARDAAEGRGEIELEKVAEAGIERLEANLTRMAIVVPEVARLEGLEVWRDGSPVSPVMLGMPLPVDPGTHIISARASGHRPWATQVGIVAGKTTITITVPLLESEPSVEVGEARLLRFDPCAPRAAEPDPGRTPRMIGWGLGITGLASLAVGTAFAIEASSTRDALDGQCSGGLCSAATADHVDTLRRQSTAATAFLGIGTAALVGGALFYLTAPSPSAASERSTANLRVAPAVGPGTGGVLAVGRF